MNSIKKNKYCLKCKKPLSLNRRKFCSWWCTQNFRPKRCPICNTDFRAHQMKVYCSKGCKIKAFKINNHSSWTKPSSKKEFKICTSCKEEKRFDEYRKVNPPHRGWRGLDGFPRLSKCKICEGEKQKLKRHAKPWWRLNILAKGRAKKQKLPYDITEKDIEKIWPKDNKCPILKIDFKEGASNRDNWPSLDKIIPKKGYVKGNIAVISFRANQIKSDVTDFNIFKRFYDFYK